VPADKVILERLRHAGAGELALFYELAADLPGVPHPQARVRTSGGWPTSCLMIWGAGGAGRMSAGSGDPFWHEGFFWRDAGGRARRLPLTRADEALEVLAGLFAPEGAARV
jgi:hypothetical protein